MATYSLGAGLFIFDKKNQATGDPLSALESIAANGFHEVELMAEGEEWESPGSHDSASFCNVLQRCDIFPHTIHTPMSGVNLASSNKDIRRDGIARVADALRFLGELGGRTAIVHPTGIADSAETPYALENVGAKLGYAYDSVSELVRVAEQTGVRIALENLPNRSAPDRPLNSMQQLRAFITGFPSEHVGLCLDTGHARICSLDPAEQARVASERLYALHIQDVDGYEDCHWVPGSGVIDWSALGTALSDINFDGAWTIEALSARVDATADQVAESCACLRKRWESDGMSNPS